MKAILNMYDSCSENIEVIKGDYVVANTNEFGLKEGKKYKILEVNSHDLITVEVYEGHTDIYTVEYFDKYTDVNYEKNKERVEKQLTETYKKLHGKETDLKVIVDVGTKTWQEPIK